MSLAYVIRVALGEEEWICLVSSIMWYLSSMFLHILRQLASWYCRYQSGRGHGYAPLANVEGYLVEVSPTDCFLVQRSPADCGVTVWDLETSTMRRPRPK